MYSEIESEKCLWTFLVLCVVLCPSTCAQHSRTSFPTRRRPLPTVIITREHLRQQAPHLYGSYGDTAAEFIVSAGLDTSRSTAVRIRKLGNRINATQTVPWQRPAIDNRSNSSSVNEVERNRPTSYDGSIQRKRPVLHPQTITRRQEVLNERNNVFHHPYLGPGGPSGNRPAHLYVPPIFVPRYQQNGDFNNRRPDQGHRGYGTTYQSNPVVYRPEYRSPVVHSGVQPPVEHSRRVQATTGPVSVTEEPVPTTLVDPHDAYQKNHGQVKDDVHKPTLVQKGIVAETPVLKLNAAKVNSSPNLIRRPSLVLRDQITVNELPEPSGRSRYGPRALDQRRHKRQVQYPDEQNILSTSSRVIVNANSDNDSDESDEAQWISADSYESQVLPSLRFSKDYWNPQRKNTSRNTTYNSYEPQESTSKSVFEGLENREIGKERNALTNSSNSSQDLPSKKGVLSNYRNPQRKNASGSITNSSHEPQEFPSLKSVFDNFRYPEIRQGTDTSKNFFNDSYEPQETPSSKRVSEDYRKPQRTGRNHPARRLYESHRIGGSPRNLSDSETSQSSSGLSNKAEKFISDDSEDSTASDYGEVMSFSDFLASPIAEKIRLERQFAFRDSNTTDEVEEAANSTTQYNYQSFLRNATLLRNLIAARLLHGILNQNESVNSTRREIPDPSGVNSRSSSDRISPAEQRQFGIVVSPYDGLESIGSKSTMPIIRVLRGKIVPLPDLPQELIPILLGTYKPTYTSETSYDDPKFTESILDKAILSLLQNEDFLGTRPGNSRVRPTGPRFNRKSPSTNYVGSLKANEPKGGYFKPAEWSLGPRCDRLTEEICLDDSDYPSSAIMSSIYKDKTKFDLMYAEVKVRESQVEGLSRQQEQAYTADHLYGQASNHMGRDPVGGFVCPSEVHYARPHRAKNRKGEWKVVVNVAEYTQTMRMEKCLTSGNPCKYVMPHLQSTCAQVYSYHRLLVFNKDLGLHIDLFRVPTGCTCHLRADNPPDIVSKYSAPVPHVYRPGYYEEFGGHVETAPSSQFAAEGSGNGSKKKNNFSSTLWAILGGGPQAGALAQQSQFQDEVQKQISWTQQLKQYPQLMKQISPNQVLKQLLEDEDDDYSIRRQRIRHQPSPSIGYPSRGVPVALPHPHPVVIARRPVVSAAPSPDRLFGMPATKVFSLTQDGQGRNHLSDEDQRTVVQEVYKITPGMYHPSRGSAEKMQVSEASLVPVAPQFNENASEDSGMRPVLRPLPVPKGSEKQVVDDDDLLAVEKSERPQIQAFKIETMTEDHQTEEPFDHDDSKINFSYHPILEYLNF